MMEDSASLAYYFGRMNTLATTSMPMRQFVLLAYGTYLILISLIAFIAYYDDKRKAKMGAYRTKEKTLLLLSFLGGAFGGFPAMLIFHHKTKGEHWYFTAINLLGIAIHVTLLLLVAFVFPL